MAPALRIVLLLTAAVPACRSQTTTATTTSFPIGPSSATFSSMTCASGLHLIVARGSGEPKGLGKIGVVAENVIEAVPGSTAAAVDYPATIEAYFASEDMGVAAMTAMIAGYVADCPSSKLALLGYSQGGQVAMDVVCGTSEPLFAVTPALSDAFRNHVIAVVTFGDPSHMVNQPWDEGTSNHDGIFYRNNTAACEPYSAVIRGWCDHGDIYCDAGNETDVHGTYFAKYTGDATNWIVSNWNKSTAAATSTSSGSPTPSASAGASSTLTPPPGTKNAAGVLQPSGVVLLAFLAVAGAAFGMLL